MLVLNCLIVEDEALAARIIADYIKDIPGLTLSGICEDVFCAAEKLRQEQIDLIFLDINLPKVNGIEFLKMLSGNQHVVLTTAYHQYAVEGFNLDATDYLLKPITFERFLKAVNKVKDYRELLAKDREPGGSPAAYFYVKTSNGLEKVVLDTILYVESLQNYIVIHTRDRKIMTYSTLKNVEAFLPANRFLKVQKSFIVALDKIDLIDGTLIVVGGNSISISRANKDEILQAILANNILRR